MDLLQLRNAYLGAITHHTQTSSQRSISMLLKKSTETPLKLRYQPSRPRQHGHGAFRPLVHASQSLDVWLVIFQRDYLGC